MKFIKVTNSAGTETLINLDHVVMFPPYLAYGGTRTEVHLIDGEMITSSMTVQQIEQILKEQL